MSCFRHPNGKHRIIFGSIGPVKKNKNPKSKVLALFASEFKVKFHMFLCPFRAPETLWGLGSAVTQEIGKSLPLSQSLGCLASMHLRSAGGSCWWATSSANLREDLRGEDEASAFGNLACYLENEVEEMARRPSASSTAAWE